MIVWITKFSVSWAACETLWWLWVNVKTVRAVYGSRVLSRCIHGREDEHLISFGRRSARGWESWRDLVEILIFFSFLEAVLNASVESKRRNKIYFWGYVQKFIFCSKSYHKFYEFFQEERESSLDCLKSDVCSELDFRLNWEWNDSRRAGISSELFKSIMRIVFRSFPPVYMPRFWKIKIWYLVRPRNFNAHQCSLSSWLGYTLWSNLKINER